MELLKDILSIIREPREAFKELLSNSKTYYSKFHIALMIFMHCYFLFLPSYLIILNIIAIILFFVSISMVYYICQELAMLRPEEEDNYFYKVAYCLSLAQAPGLVLNLLNNFLCISISGSIIIGLFFAAIINIPIAAIVLYYQMQVVKSLDPSARVQQFFELISLSFITTCKEKLGFSALRDIIVDFKLSS